MQIFTYKKEGFANLNIYVDRVNDRGDGYLTPPEYTAIWEEKNVYTLRTQREQRTELLTIKD